MFEVITNYILSLLQAFKHNQVSLYFSVFLVAFLESVPVIGTFMPGTLLLLVFGLVAAKGFGILGMMIFLSTIGATLGDICGYLLGKYGRRFFKEHNKILKLAHLHSGQLFFEKHGDKSILFGRFIGPIRPIVSLIAGATHFPPEKFLKWNIIGAFLWSGTYILIGFVFAKYIRLIDRIVSEVGGIAFIALIVGMAGYFYFQKRKEIVKD